MVILHVILPFLVFVCHHEVTATSSRQYNSIFKRNMKENLMKHSTVSKSTLESQLGLTPKRRRQQKTTSVTIKSCNAEFCDPGWEPYPNIVSSVTGYNILKGNAYNPGTQHDPGFETGYIFIPVVKDDDNRYALHGGITIRAISKCDLSMNTQIVSTVKGYQNINREVQGTYEGWKTNPPVKISAKNMSTELPPLFEAFGAANEGLWEQEEFFTKRKGVLTVNDATCALYAMQISRRYPPPFQQPFKNAVKALSEATTADERKSEFRKFIQDFGTHFVQKATIGARLSIVRRYSRDTFKEASFEDVENCNKHRLAYFYVKEESGDNCTNLESAGESMIFKNLQREQIISYGSKPSDSLNDWANQEFESPVPIKMTLVPIIELFHKDFMQIDQYTVPEYEIIKEWMAPLYGRYCEDMKADLGIEVCNPGAVKRCGYNDDCNPAYEDCAQTSANTYTCKAIITKAYLKEKVREAMNEITGGMKAVDVAQLIQSNVFDDVNGIEGYVFVKTSGYGNLEVAGENADKTEKDSFEVAYAWASSDKIGRASNFQRVVEEALHGTLCQPFNTQKKHKMDEAIEDINGSGHHVTFFIHASDEARPDHEKTGASTPSPDYNIQTGCSERNQYVLIGPGGR